MNKVSVTSKDFSDLRQRAERQLKEFPASATLGVKDVQELLHELQIRQVELEMQNQELSYAETRAEANLKRFTDLYESAPVGYLILNYEGAIHMVNPTGKSILGHRQNMLVGQNIKNFISAESQAALKNFLQESFLPHETGQEKIECELLLARKGGENRYVHIEGFSTEGYAECRIVMTDITERKKTEDSLKRESQMNRALLRLIRDGVCIFDCDGSVLQANDTLCRMLGHTQEELLSMNIAQWNTQWSADELKDRIENVKSSNPKFETRYRCRDGSIIDVEVNESSVVIDGQRLILNAVRSII